MHPRFDTVLIAGGGCAGMVGWISFENEAFDSDVSYSSVVVKSPKGADWDMLMANANPPHVMRSAIAMKYDCDTYLLTMCGLKGERTPKTHEEISAFIKGLCAPTELLNFLQGATFTSKISYHRNGSNRVRQVHQTKAVQYFLVGDGLTRLNPYFGFGLSMALFQAEAMQRLLQRGGDSSPQSFYLAVDRSRAALVKYVRANESSWHGTGDQRKGYTMQARQKELLWEAAVNSRNLKFARILRDMFHLKFRPSRAQKAALYLDLVVFYLGSRLQKVTKPREVFRERFEPRSLRASKFSGQSPSAVPARIP